MRTKVKNLKSLVERHKWGLLFFLVLWLGSTLFLGGDLGQWNDDYAYDRRDFISGVPNLPLGGLLPGYFYRPLYYLIVPTLETAFGGRPTVLHFVSAIAHGMAGVLMWHLLIRLGCRKPSAFMATALFLVYPAHWEVAFWPAALPTGLATSLFLLLCLCYLNIVAGLGSRLLVLASVLLAFAIPCLNEQPAAAIPGLLLLLPIAASRGAAGARWRAWSVITLCIGAVVLYVVLYRVTAPLGVRGASGTLTTLDELPQKLNETYHKMRYALFLRKFGTGAAIQGLTEMTRCAHASIALFASLSMAAVGLMREARWRGQSRPAVCQMHPVRLASRVILFGAAVFALGWAPVLLVRFQSVEPRLCYLPSVGMLIVAAGLVDFLAHLTKARSGARPVSVLAWGVFLWLCLSGMVMMVGIQGALKSRWHRDHDEASQLRAAVTDLAPRLLFVPLRIDNTATGTRVAAFDGHFFGPLERPWSAPFYIRRTFARPGYDCSWWSRSMGWSPVKGAEQRGLRYDDSALHRFERLPGEFQSDDTGARLLPWDRIVPFIIDSTGHVCLVASVIVVRADGMELQFGVPTVMRQPLASPIRLVSVRFPDTGSADFEILPGYSK